MLFAAASLALAALSVVPKGATAATIEPISIYGTKFFYPNGTQFYVQGVAYQPAIGNGTNEDSTGGFVDPLGDTAGCERDIPYLQALNVNLIRTYAIDTTLDHSGCIEAFGNAGIYIISDLSAPGTNTSIDRDNPEWTVDIFERYISVVDLLAQYDNVLGFFAGNEVTSNSSNTYASAFVKAAIRDTKAYIQQQGYRNIPVGYSANDDSTTREPEAEYFACAPAAASADFYGINMYEWCGDATYESSGYEARTAEFSNYSIPIFFSEYGCNVPEPRLFNEVQALYGSEMTPVWSGGIVYEYFQEVNDYGLVSQIGSSVSPLPDYTALSSQLNNIKPSRTMNSTYTPSNTPPPCPSPENAYWVAATALPPTPNQGLCSCAPPTWGCAARSTLPAENITELFGYICGSLGVNCAGINANGTFPGEYGAYSPCSDIVKLSFLMNMYYDSQKQVAGACDFGGQATTQKAQSATGTCSVLIAEAGSSGTGSVTATAGLVTGTGSSSPTGSGSGSGSSSSSTSKSAGHSVVGGLYGEMRVVVAIACAFFGGAAIVLL